MDTKDLKKYLAGLGIAGLLAGGSLMAAEAPKSGEAPKSTPKSEETTTAKDTTEKPAQPKSGWGGMTKEKPKSSWGGSK